MKNSRKILTILAAVILAGVVILSVLLMRQRYCSVTVRNGTPATLTGISVSDGDGSEWFSAAPVGGISRHRFLITANGPLVLEVKSMSGSWTLKPKVGFRDGLALDVTVKADGTITVVER